MDNPSVMDMGQRTTREVQADHRPQRGPYSSLVRLRSPRECYRGRKLGCRCAVTSEEMPSCKGTLIVPEDGVHVDTWVDNAWYYREQERIARVMQTVTDCTETRKQCAKHERVTTAHPGN